MFIGRTFPICSCNRDSVPYWHLIQFVQLTGQVTMRVVTISEARNNLKQVIDHVVDDADVAVISGRVS